MRLLMGLVTAGVLSFGSGLLYAAEPPAVKAGSGQTCAQQEAANKKIIESTFANGPSPAVELIGPGYIQHNPEATLFAAVNGLSDDEAGQEFEKFLLHSAPMPLPKRQYLPGQPHDRFPHMVLADCDIVVVVGQFWHPFPSDSSKFYATYFFNMWRMKDGKFIEHWDPDQLPSPLPDYLKVPVKDLKAAGKK
jgi:predicted SnoaL-like aldol condensation-catalyzing enzyme